MKGILSFLSFLLLVGGLQGIIHEAFDTWIPLMGFLRYLYVDGYEIFISIALLVLGTALATAASKAPKG
ncbi:hypothetical protein DSC45_22775 [Streptomyces sp. YIM 130001]|uniref:hypothetical protein n=1 Tax=Streptomyces sp. YIM 130001 TaxID=2259644 RepID=UPI000E64EB4F|nr:hypothetical protein [Streptomyces sp. YIM 130001]RII13782.1 hypothetical protein DSC45_22775 [Streptomyces sp. YIM 130001]